MIQTEPAEIYGGPLDGTRLSVAVGKNHFECGTRIENSQIGPVYQPGPNNVWVYSRSSRLNRAGNAIFELEGAAA